MIMRAIPVLLISTALGAGAIGAAVKMSPPSVMVGEDHDWEKSRPGHDRRFAILIDGSAIPILSCASGSRPDRQFW